MKNRLNLIAVAMISMGLFLTANVRAQEEAPPQPQGQPQGQPQAPTSVARLSVIHGDVTIMHGDGGQWGAATVNTPVVPGNRMSTGDRGRGEIQLDPANVIRLEQHTEAQVADLEPNKINIQLASGLVNYSVMNGTQADVEIDTPNMGVHPLSPGLYRIQVNSPSETLLIVRNGEAEVLTNQGSTKVEAGQIINIHGTDNPEYKIDPAPGADDFDKWSGDRDRQIASVKASQHSDPNYVGSSDLDTYGQWSEVPDQGWCWTPQVDAGWVPYSAGYWGMEPYWGWTWISFEPWGWAPYHSGIWFSYGGRWHWRPDYGRGGWGGGIGRNRGNQWGSAGGTHFLPRGGGVIGRPTANMPSFGTRANFGMRSAPAAFGGTRTTQPTARGSSNGWQGYQRGNQSGRGPASMNGPSTGFQGRNAPSTQGGQSNWQRYSSGNSSGRWPAAVNGPSTGWTGRSAPAQGNQSWQRYASPNPYTGGRQNYGYSPRSYSGGGYENRSGGSYYGGGSRPPLQLNRPIMRERAPSGGGYGGGRSYSAPSGGGHSAPSGGGHSYSAPSGGGGGGGHSGGGGHGGGHR